MRKQELIESIRAASNINAHEADEALAAILDHITNALARGESLNLVGFGSFTVKTRAARTGRNPQTGEEIVVPASQAVTFKPGKGLKEKIQ